MAITISTTADAACIRFRHFDLTSEGPWHGHGTIEQRKTCSGSFRAGGTWTFKRLLLSQALARGKVRLQQGGTYFYTAPTGYSGSDNFTLRVCGKEGAIDACANLINNMTVK